MSTLKATNLSHASAASPNIVLDSAGKVTFGGAVVGAGMDLITPTSVAGTGVTLSGGKVSFSAATSVSVNGCFTATYDNYALVADFTAASANNAISLRLRVGGVDATTNYAGVRLYTLNTTVGADIDPTGTDEWYVTATNSTRPTSDTHLYCNGPAKAAITTYTAHSFGSGGSGGGSLYQFLLAGNHTTTTAYDGFTIFTDTGTFAGTLRVYGLRNS